MWQVHPKHAAWLQYHDNARAGVADELEGAARLGQHNASPTHVRWAAAADHVQPATVPIQLRKELCHRPFICSGQRAQRVGRIGCPELALMAKLLQAEMVSRMAKTEGTASWQTVPSMVASIDVSEVQRSLAKRLAEEKVEAETPEQWVQHLVQVRRKFGFGSVKVMSRPKQETEPPKQVTEALMWEATLQ